MVNPDSPFKRLPTATDDRQLVFLDGISLTVEMHDAAYSALRRLLAEESPREQPKWPAKSGEFLMYVWSLVDSAWRFLGLIQHVPGIKSKDQNPQHRRLVQLLEPMEGLRHRIQHLEGYLNKETDDLKVEPVWGAVSWVAPISSNSGAVTVAVPGTLRLFKGLQIVKPAGHDVEGPVDLITLQSAGAVVSLSEIRREILAWFGCFERGLEVALEQGLSEHNRLTIDLVGVGD